MKCPQCQRESIQLYAGMCEECSERLRGGGVKEAIDSGRGITAKNLDVIELLSFLDVAPREKLVLEIQTLRKERRRDQDRIAELELLILEAPIAYGPTADAAYHFCPEGCNMVHTHQARIVYVKPLAHSRSEAKRLTVQSGVEHVAKQDANPHRGSDFAPHAIESLSKSVEELAKERDDYRNAIVDVLTQNRTRGYPTGKEWIQIVADCEGWIAKWEAKP